MSGCPVMHVVGHVRDHHGKVHGRIEIRERLNVGALARIKPDAFKTDGGIVLSDVLPGKTRAIHPARGRGDVRAASRKVLSIEPP